MNRREFIQPSTQATLRLALPQLSLGADERRINLAMLGTGWWGTDLLLASALASGKYNSQGC